MPRPGRRPDKPGAPPLVDKNVHKLPDSLPSPVVDPSNEQDLGARLTAIVGADLATFDPSDERLTGWNRAFTHTTHARFEHRTLVGIAINRRRPERGQVNAYNERIAKLLGRNARWVRDTANVAAAIQAAISDGVQLPLEIREVYWRAVPSAVQNVRQGHPLDWKPDKLEQAKTLEELEAAVTKAQKALEKALQAFPDPERWAELREECVERLRGLEGPETEEEGADEEPLPQRPVSPPGGRGPAGPGEGLDDSPGPGQRPRKPRRHPRGRGRR